jgi:hypothetical protein
VPAYRDDLRLLYLASLEAGTGQLAALQMAPMRARKMRLHPVPTADRQWLKTVLDQISRRFGSRVDLRTDSMLALHPAPALPYRGIVRRSWWLIAPIRTRRTSWFAPQGRSSLKTVIRPELIAISWPSANTATVITFPS